MCSSDLTGTGARERNHSIDSFIARENCMTTAAQEILLENFNNNCSYDENSNINDSCHGYYDSSLDNSNYNNNDYDNTRHFDNSGTNNDDSNDNNDSSNSNNGHASNYGNQTSENASYINDDSHTSSYTTSPVLMYRKEYLHYSLSRESNNDKDGNNIDLGSNANNGNVNANTNNGNNNSSRNMLANSFSSNVYLHNTNYHNSILSMSPTAKQFYSSALDGVRVKSPSVSSACSSRRPSLSSIPTVSQHDPSNR